MLAGLLVLGVMVSLGFIVGGLPLFENLLGQEVSPQLDDQKSPLQTIDHSVQVTALQPSWHLSTQEKNKATLVVLPSDPTIQRVEVTQADTATGWHIQLSQNPIMVRGQEWYSLRFRARADDVRTMGASVMQAHGPWEGLGLYRSVPLMKQWQDYEWEFLATEDDANAQIKFDIGGWNVPVEVVEVRLLRLSNKTMRWKLHFQDGSEAGLVEIPGSPLGTRVAITKSPHNNPKHIQLVQQGVKLQLNERYRMRFNARADTPRDLSLKVSQGEYPWESLGLTQTVSVDGEWQLFDLEFVATKTEENANLTFDLGGYPIPVEIDAVLLQKNSKMVTHSEDSTPSLGATTSTQENVEQS